MHRKLSLEACLFQGLLLSRHWQPWIAPLFGKLYRYTNKVPTPHSSHSQALQLGCTSPIVVVPPLPAPWPRPDPRLLLHNLFVLWNDQRMQFGQGQAIALTHHGGSILVLVRTALWDRGCPTHDWPYEGLTKDKLNGYQVYMIYVYIYVINK